MLLSGAKSEGSVGRSLFERAVAYDGDLMVAAHEVLAELDDTDGVVVGTKAFRLLVREMARKHNVGVKDLRTTVMELCEDD